MARVLTTKADVKRAMFRQGMGWVDFVWGSIGGEIARNGKSLGGKGVSHILHERQLKQGLSPEQAREVAVMLVEVIAPGNETYRNEQSNGSLNVRIDHRGYRAVLVQHKRANSWLLTGFERTSGEAKTGFDASGSTHSATTRTHRRVGADE